MKLWCLTKTGAFLAHEALPIGNGRMGGMVHGGQGGDILCYGALLRRQWAVLCVSSGEHLLMRDVREAYLYLDIETSFRE